MPWTPIFLAGIMLFHPWLGMLALAGGALLMLITLLNQLFSRSPVAEANTASHQASLMSERDPHRGRDDPDAWACATPPSRAGRRRAIMSLERSVAANDVGGTFSSLTKALRLFLQSAMLGLGAYLVLQDELTAGAMIAASILLGRALAPIEMAIGQWPLVQRAVEGLEQPGRAADQGAARTRRAPPCPSRGRSSTCRR